MSTVEQSIENIKQQVAQLRRQVSAPNFIEWRDQYMEDCLIDQSQRKSALLAAPSASIGAYLIYGRDGRCWYVGETSEHFRIRMNRHNTRSDLLANRLLHPAEWGQIELFQVATKAETKQIEAHLYYGLIDRGIALLNPKIPARPSDCMPVPEPTMTINFAQQSHEYMSNAFALHTLELGEWVLTARNLPGYRTAFAVRWNYLQSLKPDQISA